MCYSLPVNIFDRLAAAVLVQTSHGLEKRHIFLNTIAATAWHCAAERKPDVFERDPKHSMFLNVDVTRNLAETAGKLIFII
jgi:hypothetical protein